MITGPTSGIFQEMMHELQVKQLVSSTYHPQSQGVTKGYHQTLRSMIKICHVSPSTDSNCNTIFIVAIRASVNVATGFSPFELVNGHQVRGLKMVKELLLQSSS